MFHAPKPAAAGAAAGDRHLNGARGVALVYNWWNIFVRLAEPDKHLEAITSQPLLLAGIAERPRHGHTFQSYRPYPPPISASHSSSLNTATPSSVALSSLEPASAPAMT
jgi:hypothetical protein